LKQLTITYRDYQPGKHIVDGEDFAFQCEDGGWSIQTDVEEKVAAGLRHVLSHMEVGDSLKIIIEHQESK
jgi:hypothetical protein